MKIRLSGKDIQLLTFLGKYKMMLATESKKIYKSKDYHYKRLKILEQAKYIKRVNTYYIKLDINGKKLIKEFAYDYHDVCRKTKYKNRVQEIVKIATLTIGSTIEFIPSWELKDKRIFTEVARKYIGELIYQEKNYITYYISEEKGTLYIRQVINDIQKTVSYKNLIIFIEDFKILNKSNQYFIFGKQSTQIIKPTKKNFDAMRIFQELDFYEVLTKIYNGKEILLSNWEKADYMTSQKEYIVLMPFIDTEKLHKLNTYYNNNKKTRSKIDIITLKENKEKVKEILNNSVNIVELDNWLGGMADE